MAIFNSYVKLPEGRYLYLISFATVYEKCRHHIVVQREFEICFFWITLRAYFLEVQE
jgi:hypothetical protein